MCFSASIVILTIKRIVRMIDYIHAGTSLRQTRSSGTSGGNSQKIMHLGIRYFKHSLSFISLVKKKKFMLTT